MSETTGRQNGDQLSDEITAVKGAAAKHLNDYAGGGSVLEYLVNAFSCAHVFE